CGGPASVQLAGCDPAAMAEAARIAVGHGANLIDINFGCPVKKVVKRLGGSGCLQDLGLVERVIRAVIAGTHLPVTCKIRSGWNEEMRDPVGIARRCEDAGVRAIALHPRTRTQMYTGHAHWDEIAAVAAALTIPVIGNGDIRTAEDAMRMRRETNCDAVMIARGAFGQPWIFAETRALLNGQTPPPAPTVSERFAVALEHARIVREYTLDPEGAAIEFRKHLGWYVKGLPDSASLRRRLHVIESFGEIEGIFAEYLARGGERDEPVEENARDVAAGAREVALA
ncbi:MAG TPA: tRNA-dihydrouridine synthase, partial [Gemmatimonadaceae bacterium]|nr:tRNA-dihydrouridine synthase [Gemmatimonadaceae bacterium]